MVNKFKSERGSITVYVLVAMLFLLAIVTGKYLLANRQLESQISALKSIQSVYDRPITDDGTVADSPSPSTSTSTSPSTASSTSPSTSPSNSSSTNTSPATDDVSDPDKINPSTIDDTNVVIPIYNADAFTYFRSGSTKPYYIYQEGAMYVGGSNKKYKLMSDIKVEFNQSTLYWDSFLSKIDFNNHAIATNDDNFFWGYQKWNHKWWYDSGLDR